MPLSTAEVADIDPYTFIQKRHPMGKLENQSCKITSYTDFLLFIPIFDVCKPLCVNYDKNFHIPHLYYIMAIGDYLSDFLS